MVELIGFLKSREGMSQFENACEKPCFISMPNDERLKTITAMSRTLGRWEAEWREICTFDCREQNENDNVGAPRLAAHWRLGEKHQKCSDYEVIKPNLRQAKTPPLAGYSEFGHHWYALQCMLLQEATNSESQLRLSLARSSPPHRFLCHVLSIHNRQLLERLFFLRWLLSGP